MNRSKDIGQLSAALSKAQATMKAAAFDATNPHFKSKYATLAACFEAAKPVFEAGLSISQDIEIEEGRVKVTTLLMHASGEWIESIVSLKPRADSPQDVGACATYGRRYGLSAIIGLSSDEDDDGNSQATKPAKPVAAPATVQKIEKPEANEVPAAPPAAPAKTADQIDGKKVAEEIKAIRAKLQAKHHSNIEGMQGTINEIVGRKVSHLTELSADDRKKVLEVLK